VLGGFTEECLHSLKLIVSFSQEQHMIDKYRDKSGACHKVSNRFNLIMAVFYGVFRIFIFGFFVYCYYIATIFVEKKITNPSSDKMYNVEDIVAITQALIISMFASMGIQTHLTNII